MESIKIKTLAAIAAIITGVGLISATNSFAVVPAFADQGTPGIPPGCPNPSGDNQCGEVPRQREIGQTNDRLHGYSTEQQDPNGVSGQCFGESISGTATLTTPNPNPTERCP